MKKTNKTQETAKPAQPDKKSLPVNKPKHPDTKGSPNNEDPEAQYENKDES